MAEQETRQDVLLNLANDLKNQMGDVKTICQNLELDMKNLKNQFRSFTSCIIPATPSYLSIPSYHDSLCSGQLVTKLKLHQLVDCANHKIQQNPKFSEKGQCAYAADQAFEWINTSFPLMRPRLISDAIIIRPNAEDPLLYDGIRDDVLAKNVELSMHAAMWTGEHKPTYGNWTTGRDPVWKCLTPHPNTTRRGCLHSVVLVTTEEGRRVCLDLSIGQFLEEELFGVMLYYNDA